MDTKKKQKLKRFIKELESIRGRHTELVSVYVPTGYEIIKIIQHLQQEQGTAENIRDKTTKLHVIDSLERAIRHLRLYKKTPENGLAIFAGNIAAQEGKTDLKVWSIEPPEPITTRLYRCDQTFVLDILKQQLEIKDYYGLIILDNREATIGLLKGTLVQELNNMTSGVPGKIKAGGQCLSLKTNVYLDGGIYEIEQPYETHKKEQFFKIKYLSEVEVGDEIKALDLRNNKILFTKVKNKWEVTKDKYLEIISGAWNVLASEDHLFFKKDGKKIVEVLAKNLKAGDYLVSEPRSKMPIKIQSIKKHDKKVKMIDIETEEGNFFTNDILVHNSQQRFARLREGAAHEFYQRIAEYANKEFYNKPEIKGIILGGPGPTKYTFLDGDYLNNEVKKKILGVKDLSYTGEFGLHELVDKSHDLLAKEAVTEEKNILNKFFVTLAKEPEKTTYGKERTKKALEYGAVDLLLLSEDLDDKTTDEFTEIADKFNTKVEIISVDTNEGKQLKELGRIAAILRFALNQ